MRFRCLVIALVFLAAFASDSSGQSQRPPGAEQTKAAQQPSTPDPRGTAQSPAVVKILPPDDAEAKAKQEAQDRAAKDQLDWNTIKLGIAAIIVALLQFIAIGVQAWFLWRTVKVSETAARVAGESAQAVVSQLRAYVHIVGKDFLVQGEDHERFVNQIRILNSGQTPAYKLQIQSVTRTLPYPLPAEFDFDATPKGRYPSVMMVGPNSEVGHDSLADIVLSPIEMANIMREDSGIRLYSYGTVKYEDCFERSRFTNFCYFLGWNITPEGYTLSVHATEQHNDAK